MEQWGLYTFLNHDPFYPFWAVIYDFLLQVLYRYDVLQNSYFGFIKCVVFCKQQKQKIVKEI